MINNKKIIVPTLVATVTLLLLVLGATYAYIQVQATSNFGTPSITGAVSEIGNVTINRTSELTLNLVYTQVAKPNQDITYYATASGASTDAQSPAIATASVSGPGIFTCNYTLSVTAEGSIFSNSVSLGEGLLKLTVNGGVDGTTPTVHDFNNSWSTKTITGSLTGLTSSSPKNITAQLYFVNSANTNQYALSGTSGTVTFTITSFDCTATG